MLGTLQFRRLDGTHDLVVLKYTINVVEILCNNSNSTLPLRIAHKRDLCGLFTAVTSLLNPPWPHISYILHVCRIKQPRCYQSLPLVPSRVNRVVPRSSRATVGIAKELPEYKDETPNIAVSSDPIRGYCMSIPQNHSAFLEL